MRHPTQVHGAGERGKRRKRGLMVGGALVLTILILPSPAHAEPLYLTRADAVLRAQQQNEAHRSVLLESDRVRGLYLEARAGALPNLTLEGQASLPASHKRGRCLRR